jgi:hypothetical protein
MRTWLWMCVVLLAAVGCRKSPPSERPSGSTQPASAPAAEMDTDRLFPAEIDGAWGYIDAAGRIRIEPTYQHAELFSEHLAAVLLDGLWGFVDRSGRLVIRAQFQAVHPGGFSQGRASVLLKGRWGSVDRRGRLVVPALYEAPILFGEGGLAPLREGRAYGYIDLSGQVVIAPRFSYARPFAADLAAVQVGGVWRGRRLRGGSWGYIDREGTLVIPARFGQAGDFSPAGLAPVYHRPSSPETTGPLRFAGYIDTEGSVAIAPEGLSEGGAFSESLAAVRDSLTGLWGYVDPSGERVIEARYVRVEPFGEGLAAVAEYVAGESSGLRWGYIDAVGGVVIPPRFERAGAFLDGLAPVAVDGRAGYVDRTGRAVWLRR